MIMASSKVMVSSSPANQDLQRHHHHQASDHNSGNLMSMNMDDLLKNIYEEGKAVDDGWKEIAGDPEMTLEDFLTKAGAVREEDVSKLPVPEYTGVIDPVIVAGNGNGVIGRSFPQGGRGKRKVVVEDPPVDKATQQKQRRMIKNRESAARSRERKQAYTVELESLVAQWEEEHARLVKEVDELNKERLKQLMENLMPVVEKRRPPRLRRRTNSM
ncbi:bZIP transcription factor 12-like [Bidens hawaiensis]|uniref:bZIP transcription factor 12-like n=1 Tax=Bidens hawaiensis TaxID=980011 RepID=UPI0040491A22